MEALARSLFGPLLLLAAGCLQSPRATDYDEFLRAGGARPLEPPDAAALVADEAGLAQEARIEPMLRLALARNPDLLEEADRVHERVDRVPLAGRLPDLELKYEQWGVPLARPWALGDADTLMLGLRQSFPAAGSRGRQERAAEEEADIARDALRTRQLDVARELRHAAHEYALADAEVRIHLAHVGLTERILEVTRGNFRIGRATQQDVLRVQVELTGLHRDVISIEQRQQSAAARLNALMGRAPDAPLGPAAALTANEIGLDAAALAELAARTRPELAGARHGVARSQAMVEAARRTATWPTVMVGLDYWFMAAAADQHAYGAMVSINLPWLNPSHHDEIRAAERARAADRRAVDAAANTIRYEVRDAWARYAAARRDYGLLHADLAPAAQRSLEAAQSEFATGGGSALAVLDASRSLLEVRLDEARAIAALASAIADLERAVGTDLDVTAITDGAAP